MDLLTELAILVLAAFVGFEVISKVPNTLHTPLMSATNAIHGIVLLGAILVIGPADGFLNDLLLVIAIAFGTINVVGGFLVTDRMLGMFKGQEDRDPAEEKKDAGVSRLDWVNLLYIVGFSLFIVGLRMVRGPRTAVRGNLIAAAGMVIALIGTLIDPRIGDWLLIVVGVVIGTLIGVPAARGVKMTAMPQMVALFNGVGGGAVALISLVEFRSESDIELEALIPIVLAAIIGSISFWGSNVAFSKLQELPWTKRRFPVRELTIVNSVLTLVVAALAVIIVARRRRAAPVLAAADRRRPARDHRRAADRRRRHAGRHLDPERVHRPQRRRGGHRPRQHRADRGRACSSARPARSSPSRWPTR